MDNNKRKAQFFGRDGFGRSNPPRGDWGRDRNRDRDGRDKQMFKTKCSNCGRDCEVPFRPTNTKPVYCNDCFPKFRNTSDRQGERRSFDNRDRNRGGQQVDVQLKNSLISINAKLDKILSKLSIEADNTGATTYVEVTAKPSKKPSDKEELEVKEGKEIPEIQEVLKTVEKEVANVTSEKKSPKAKKSTKKKE